MNEILDYEEKEVTLKFQKMALWTLIIIILVFVIGYNLMPLFVKSSSDSELDFMKNIMKGFKFLESIGNLLAIVGLFSLGLSIKNKEPKKYQFWIATIGLLLYLIGHFI